MKMKCSCGWSGGEWLLALKRREKSDPRPGFSTHCPVCDRPVDPNQHATSVSPGELS